MFFVKSINLICLPKSSEYTQIWLFSHGKIARHFYNINKREQIFLGALLLDYSNASTSGHYISISWIFKTLE